MNDETLDQELQALFAPNTVTVDPNGDAATALLDDITKGPQSFIDASTVAEPVLDGKVFPPQNGELAEPRSWILVAAVVALIAALGFGTWTALTSDSGPVATDDGISDAATPRGLIQSGSPLLTLVVGDADQLGLVQDCLNQLADSDSFVEEHAIASSLNVAHVLEAESGFDSVVFFDDGVIQSTCTTPFASSRDAFTSIQPLTEPVRVMGNGGSGTEWLVWGMLSDDVADMRIVEPLTEDQVFRRQGPWFAVSALGNADDVSEPVIEGTLVDGTVRTGEASTFTGLDEFGIKCVENCVSTKLRELADEARASGVPAAQVERLSDGELTQAEYDAAVVDFEDCVAASASIELPVVIPEDADGAGGVVKCHVGTLYYVELARAWHNYGVLNDNQFELATEAPDEMVDEVSDSASDPEGETSTSVDPELAWEAIAQELFDGGLDEAELDRLWDGYPYRTDEKAERITAYLQDFSWVQSNELEIEFNQYSAFAGSEFFTPIVTVQSQADPNKTVAFVMGLSGNEVRVGRLPEAGDGLEFELVDTTANGKANLVVVDGVGAEGGPAAFVGPTSLDISVDFDALTTTIALPNDVVPGSVLTIAFPTPELAAASAIVLE